MFRGGTEVKVISGFPNYAISRNGRVWSFPRERSSTFGMWRKSGKCGGGYLKISLWRNGQEKTSLIHRLVLETYVGSCPLGMEACHNNGNKQDNRIENLRWDTRSNNHQDKRKHGTFLEGDRSPLAKVSKQDVGLIFNAYHDGAYFQSELADMFGISQTEVCRIVNNKRWKNVDKTPILDMASA